MRAPFELHRQLLHICYGLAIIALIYGGNLSANFFLGLFILELSTSFLYKKYPIPFLHHCLLYFEREKHLQKFPGRGLVFFTLGVYITLLIFTQQIALASIVILTFGDAFTNLIGFYFGKKVSFLNKKKKIEGTLGGIVISTITATVFVPFLSALIASIIAMVLEAPEWKIGKIEIDDNLIIPLIAGTTLNILI